MTAPNIIGVTSVTGETDVLEVTTSPSVITQNANASNAVYKINSLIVSNVDGASSSDVSVDLFRGGTPYYFTRLVTVPANSTLVIMSRENAIYLEEGDALRITASTNGDLQSICSYDIITDQ